MSHANSPCRCHEKAASAGDPFALEASPEAFAFDDLSGDSSDDDGFLELEQVRLDDDVQAIQELEDAVADGDDGDVEDDEDDGQDGLVTLTRLLARHPGLRITLSQAD